MGRYALQELIPPTAENWYAEPGTKWFGSDVSKYLHTQGVRRSRAFCGIRMTQQRYRFESTPENRIDRPLCPACLEWLAKLEDGKVDLPSRDRWPCDLSRFVGHKGQHATPGNRWFQFPNSPNELLIHTDQFNGRVTLCGIKTEGVALKLVEVDGLHDGTYQPCLTCKLALARLVWPIFVPPINRNIQSAARTQRAPRPKSVLKMRFRAPKPVASEITYPARTGATAPPLQNILLQVPATTAVVPADRVPQKLDAPASVPAVELKAPSPALNGKAEDAKKPIGSTKLGTRKNRVGKAKARSAREPQEEDEILGTAGSQISASQLKLLRAQTFAPFFEQGSHYHEVLYSMRQKAVCGAKQNGGKKFGSEAEAEAIGLVPCEDCFEVFEDETPLDCAYELSDVAHASSSEDGLVDLYEVPDL